VGLGNLFQFKQQDRAVSVAKKPAAEVSQTTNRTDKAIAVQSVIGGEGSQFDNIHLGLDLNLADREFFFDIELRAENGKALPGNIELEVGCFYLVRVSVSLNRFVDSPDGNGYPLKQAGVRIERKLDLTLVSSTLKMHGDIHQLELQCRHDWYRDFLVQASDCCQGESSSLQLRYQETDSQNLPRFASSLDIKVRAYQNATPPRTVKLPDSISNAENAVVLYIIPNGEEEWLLQGISPHESIDRYIKIPNPDTPLDLWTYGKTHLGGVVKWLRDAIADFGDKCSFVILDATSQQIQWEMVELKPSEYLGVKAEVVRWVEQEAWGDPIVLDLAKQRTYMGRLVAYDHPANLSCADIHDYLNAWREELIKHDRQPVAIGLLHCNERLTDVRFDGIARSLRDRSLFLFVNSPCSARLIWKDKIPFGIAATALSEVASGYFGTMGAIEGQLAKAVKKKFLELAGSDSGISPAVFLQRIRLSYMQMLTSEDSQKRQRAEQVFSYVYFGNPDDVVKITGGSQP
jgi:small nuclear ribonucleoprotein (snRNP)-like protein